MLRSVDMQQIFLQTTVVEKVQQVQQQHAEVERKLFAMHLQDDLEHRKKAVQNSNECEKAVIRKEEKGKRHWGGRQLTSAPDGTQDEKSPHEPVREREQGKIVDLMA